MTSYTMLRYTVYSGDRIVSRHRTLKAAGRAYQAAHTGNLRRVIDSKGDNVTARACDAILKESSNA